MRIEYENLFALVQILRADFRQLAPGDNIMPLGLLLLFPVFLIFAGGGQAETAINCAAGRVTLLRIHAKITDKHDFVEHLFPRVGFLHKTF